MIKQEIFCFEVHHFYPFSCISQCRFSHWPPIGQSHETDTNLQLSLSSEWWLACAENHSLLFIDFDLKWVTAHCLRMCTCLLWECVSEWWFTLNAENGHHICALRGLLKGDKSAMPTSQRAAHCTYLSKHTQSLSEVHSRIDHLETHSRSLSALQLCNRFFFFFLISCSVNVLKGKPQTVIL